MSSLTGTSDDIEHSKSTVLSKSSAYNGYVVIAAHGAGRILGNASGPGFCLLKYEFIRGQYEKHLLNLSQDRVSSHKPIISHKPESKGYCPEGNLLPRL